MPVSDLAIRIITLLLPGIIATIIIDTLTVHEKGTSFKFIISAIILGPLSYLLLQIELFCLYGIVWIINHNTKLIHIQFWDSLFNPKWPISAIEVIFACVASVFLALILSKAIQEKWIFKIARKFKISYKYGDEDLYMFFLNAKETDWVWVRDEKYEFTYEGHVVSFSQNNVVRELVLSEVRVYWKW